MKKPTTPVLLLCWALIPQKVWSFTASSLSRTTSPSNVVAPLWAKKKKAPLVSTATLDALDAFDDEEDTPRLSKKELKALQKNKGKSVVNKDDLLAAALQNEASFGDDHDNSNTPQLSKKEMKKALQQKQQQPAPQPTAAMNGESKPMSKKEKMLQKALELEAAAEQEQAAAASTETTPKLSKKELKALKKKEEKLAAKLAKKQAKKDAANGVTNGAENVNGVADAAPAAEQQQQQPKQKKLTLEDKIRKERPPPRIRVMETTQPGYTSLRLENVGITFRNQEVLQDVTWGVQTGDRIGLVGANGAGA